MRFRVIRRPARPGTAGPPQRPGRPAQAGTCPPAPRAAQLENPYSPVFGTPRSRELLRRR